MTTDAGQAWATHFIWEEISMWTNKRTGNRWHLTRLFTVAALALGAACATVSTSDAASEEQASVKIAQPTAHCVQYLALLSEEHKQPLLPIYGPGGSCWISSAQQSKQCDAACVGYTNALIRQSLKAGS
jgi:hypothetical protein